MMRDVTNTMRECTKEELLTFVRTYPRVLQRDVYGACEPPLVTYNDFTRGVWPDSVVASFKISIPADPRAPADSPYAKEYPESRWQILTEATP
jgi:hypothetical protein